MRREPGTAVRPRGLGAPRSRCRSDSYHVGKASVKIIAGIEDPAITHLEKTSRTGHAHLATGGMRPATSQPIRARRIRLFSSPSRYGCRVVHAPTDTLSCHRHTNAEDTPNIGRPVTHGSDPIRSPTGDLRTALPDGPRFSHVDSSERRFILLYAAGWQRGWQGCRK